MVWGFIPHGIKGRSAPIARTPTALIDRLTHNTIKQDILKVSSAVKHAVDENTPEKNPADYSVCFADYFPVFKKHQFVQARAEHAICAALIRAEKSTPRYDQPAYRLADRVMRGNIPIDTHQIMLGISYKKDQRFHRRLCGMCGECARRTPALQRIGSS